jgi:hypothetical protein
MPRTIEIVFDKFPKLAAALPEVVGQIVMETCFAIETQAKIKVPVDTGALMGSIQTEPIDETSGMVGTNMTYAPYTEYGTSRMAARPWLTPAAEGERRHFIKKMSDLESRLE